MDTADALQSFDAYLRRRAPDRRTPVSYASDVRQFQRTCDKAWESVTPQDIDMFMDQMRRAGLAAATIKRRVTALKVYFDVLADLADCPDHVNPVRLKRHSVRLGRRLPRDLSDAEVVRLWSIVSSVRDRALIAVLLEAGLRVGEVVGLTPLSVLRPASPAALASLRVCGKGQKERLVYLSAHALALVSAWLAVRPAGAEGAIFLNERTQPLTASGIEWILARYGAQIHVHLTPHRLRHTFARRLVEAGMPVETLACLMGHAQITTTQLYLAGVNPDLRAAFDQAMQRLAAPVVPAPPPPTPAPAPPDTRPAEPVYAALPDHTAWAHDLPEAVRQDCIAYIERHCSAWRPSQRQRAARRVYHDFARFFRFVLTRRPLTALSDLRREDLQAYIDDLTQRGVTAMAVKDALSRPLGLLREAQERDAPILPSVLRVQLPKLPDPLPRYLDEAALERLTSLAQSWMQKGSLPAACQAAWFFVLADTGLRACEVLDVRHEDVDLSARRLIVRSGKGDRARTVYLTARTVQAIRCYLDGYPHPAQALLFIHPDTGRPLTYDYLAARVRAMGRAAHVDGLSAHRLRHTFATRLINAGMPITSVQKLLGHDHLSTTQIYARVYDATVEQDYRRAMARLEVSQSVALPTSLFRETANVPHQDSAVKVLDNSG